jgi:hypothetical protein
MDLERGLAFLPNSKTGRKTLVLGDAVLEVLRNLPKNSIHVIEGARKDQPRTDLEKPWAADCRQATWPFPATNHRKVAHLDADPLRRAADLTAGQLSAAIYNTQDTAG